MRIKDEKEEQRAAQRAAKEKRKSGAAGVISGPEDSTVEPTATSAIAATEAEESTPATTRVAPIRTSMEDQASLRMQENADAANRGESTPMSPGTGSPDSKGKSRMSWLKTKFSKRQSKTPKPAEMEAKEEKGFVGGAALTGASANNSTASLPARDSVSTAAKAKEPEPAAETTEPATETIEPAAETTESEEPDIEPTTSATIDPATEVEEPALLPLAVDAQEPVVKMDEDEDEGISRPAREEEVSPVSPIEDEENDIEEKPKVEDAEKPEADEDETPAKDEDEEFQEARDNFDQDLAPPPTFPAEKSSSPAREAKFTEVID